MSQVHLSRLQRGRGPQHGHGYACLHSTLQFMPKHCIKPEEACCNNLHSLFMFHQRIHPWIIRDCILHPFRCNAAPGIQHTGASCVCVSLEKDRVKREDQWNTQGSGCIIPICVSPLKSLWYSCLGMPNIPFKKGLN